MKKTFVALEFIIYIAFITLDIFLLYNDSPLLCTISRALKFSGVTLCVIFVSSIYPAIKLILLLTLSADYFLIFTETYLYGVLLFILVQIGYFLYLFHAHRLSIFLHFLTCTLVTAIISLLFSPLCDVCAMDILCVLSIFYYVWLITNILLSRRISPILCLAFIYMALCDLNVGLTNLSTYLSVSTTLTLLPSVLIWIFYLPSQVLICLNYFSFSRRNTKNTVVDFS